jgi:hypothetical protein
MAHDAAISVTVTWQVSTAEAYRGTHLLCTAVAMQKRGCEQKQRNGSKEQFEMSSCCIFCLCKKKDQVSDIFD